MNDKPPNESLAPSTGLIILNVVSVCSIAIVIIVSRLSGNGEAAAGLVALLPIMIIIWLIWLITLVVDIRYVLRLAGNYTGVHVKVSKSTKILCVILVLAVLAWFLYIGPNLPK